MTDVSPRSEDERFREARAYELRGPRLMGAIARALPRPSLPRLREARLPPWRTLRRRLIAAAIVLLVLAAGYHLWLRNSSLVAVETVTVVGAEQAPELDAALRAAGLEQTTLNVDATALEAAVASDPAVRSVTATPDFPSALTIEVDLREPAGFLRSAGLVVAGDGVVLESAGSAPEGVPAIRLADVKAAKPGAAVEAEALDVARVLGAAPAPLASLIEQASLDETMGVVVEMEGGLELRFGGKGDADLKWRAAAAVLASPDFEVASYLDLSVPDRPVAGGVPDAAEEAAAIDPAAAEAALGATTPTIDGGVDPPAVAPVPATEPVPGATTEAPAAEAPAAAPTLE